LDSSVRPPGNRQTGAELPGTCDEGRLRGGAMAQDNERLVGGLLANESIDRQAGIILEKSDEIT